MHELATEFGIGPSGHDNHRRPRTAPEPAPAPPEPTQLTLL